MSLSAREQRTLSRIADQIAVSDPELAGSLVVFNQLTQGEKMPEGPQRKARRRRSRGSAWKRLQQRGTSSPAWHLLAACIFIIVALITMALVLSHTGHGAGGRSACTQLWSGACVPQ
jgi:hypothetical protein